MAVQKTSCHDSSPSVYTFAPFSYKFIKYGIVPLPPLLPKNTNKFASAIGIVIVNGSPYLWPLRHDTTMKGSAQVRYILFLVQILKQ